MDQFESQLVRILDRVTLGERGGLRKGLSKLESLGWKIKTEINMFDPAYKSFWTHELAKSVNASHKTDYEKDMLHVFFDLYRYSDHEDTDLFAPYCLCVGRIGNSCDWYLTPPKTYVEDRQDVKDQLLFF